MKRSFRLPVLAGGIVMTAVLASLAPTPSSQVHAQGAVVYYSPYGQGPYGGYGQVYVAPSPAARSVFPIQSGMFGGRPYGYSGYGNVPSGADNRVKYGTGARVWVYGGANYYRPPDGPVYVPFGYRAY